MKMSPGGSVAAGWCFMTSRDDRSRKPFRARSCVIISKEPSRPSADYSNMTKACCEQLGYIPGECGHCFQPGGAWGHVDECDEHHERTWRRWRWLALSSIALVRAYDLPARIDARKIMTL
jgi:hypothetical protein